MPTWLSALLHPNSGATPPWMRPPPSNGASWPFYPPGYQPNGGTSLIPRPSSMPSPTGGFGMPMTQATPGLPATTGNGGALVPTGGNSPPAIPGGGSLADLFGGAGTAGSLAGGARGGLAGILATLLGKTVQPQPTNSNEVPFYTMQNGKMQPNPAAAATGQLPGPQNTPLPASGAAQAPASITGGAVPLPTPRPTSFLAPPAPTPAPASNGLDNTMLGLQASQGAAGGFGGGAAPVSPMAKLMAMLQNNGNSMSNSFGIGGQ